MAYLTISFAGVPSEARRRAVEQVVADAGGRTQWRSSAVLGTTYALVESPNAVDTARLAAESEAVVYDGAVIAWAVFPAVREALPALLEAFTGPGRPDGILACRPCGAGALIEWDPARSGVGLVTKLVDVELQRFQSGRTAEVLTPLPPAIVAAIAGEGLRAPEVSSERVLEMLLER